MTFILNPALEAELLADPVFAKARAEVADDVAVVARWLAPVGPPKAGALRDSIHAEHYGDRSVVEAGAEHMPMNATWQEFGTAQDPGGQPYLRPAAEQYGTLIPARGR